MIDKPTGQGNGGRVIKTGNPTEYEGILSLVFYLSFSDFTTVLQTSDFPKLQHTSLDLYTLLLDFSGFFSSGFVDCLLHSHWLHLLLLYERVDVVTAALRSLVVFVSDAT